MSTNPSPSCLTSRLGAEVYVSTILIPRLRDGQIEIDPFPEGRFNLPELVRRIIDLNGVSVLVEKEFPPSCRRNIEPCLMRAAERKHEPLWADAFEQFVRTLLAAKLYVDAQNGGEIARKMASIQKLAQVMELYFTKDLIYEFIGGVREVLGSIARYTKSAELLFAAAHFIECEKNLDVDLILELCEEGNNRELKSMFGDAHRESFDAAIQKIQSINPK